MPMQISSMGESLYDHFFLDFIGPLPKTPRNMKYILVGVCDLTKHLTAVPTEDCSALTTANCILEHVLLRYNFPSRIITDNASNFANEVIRQLTKIFESKKIFTTPYHAQANESERHNKNLIQYIRSYINKDKDNWDQLIKYAVFAYNNTVNSTTNFSPHFLAHGYSIRIPNKLTQNKFTYNYDNLADIIHNNIADALKLAKENIHAQKLKNKYYYDQKTHIPDIKVGDWVLLKTPVRDHKFQPIYEGPYKVLKEYQSYIEILKKNKPYKIHKNHVKKAKADHGQHD